jgi:hypothetical protein
MLVSCCVLTGKQRDARRMIAGMKKAVRKDPHGHFQANSFQLSADS